MNKALVLEDFTETREWLVSLVRQAFAGITVIEAATVAQAKAFLRVHQFDLAVIDLSLPDGSGIDVIREISISSPNTYNVVATIFDDDKHIFDALAAGAQGYLLKEQPQDELFKRMQGIVRGEPPISPSIARRLLRHFYSFSVKEKPSRSDIVMDLTPREIEVLELIGKGLTRIEAGRILGISANTVAGYIRQIYKKLNVSSRSEAALEAVRLGIIS